LNRSVLHLRDDYTFANLKGAFCDVYQIAFTEFSIEHACQRFTGQAKFGAKIAIRYTHFNAWDFVKELRYHVSAGRYTTLTIENQVSAFHDRGLYTPNALSMKVFGNKETICM
jgi:hypothetical protein